MTNADIRRQYDEVIAPFYDQDPQGVFDSTGRRVITQLQQAATREDPELPFNVLDLGMGTGAFCERLRRSLPFDMQPFGLDISAQMLEVARRRLPDLICEIDDAASVASHFSDTTFDLVCTHFVTGFVPLAQLAPTIFDRMRPGGLFSFAGGTSQGYPELARLASSRLVRTLFGGRSAQLDDLLTPVDEQDVARTLRQCGFEVLSNELFAPRLVFRDFEDFMAFAWKGGWLTPFIEQIGLQKAGRMTRALLDAVVFPVTDEHRIAITLARKPADPMVVESVRSSRSEAAAPLPRV